MNWLNNLFVLILFSLLACSCSLGEEGYSSTPDDIESKRVELAQLFIADLGVTGEVKNCTRIYRRAYESNFMYTNCTIIIQNGDKKEILSIDCDLPGMKIPRCILARGF